MGCCGSNRKQFHTSDHNSRGAQGISSQGTAAPAGENAPEAPANTNGAPVSGTVHYEYVGTTAMTVRGASTGNIYRFTNYGDRIGVDANDAPSMETVPNLRRV